VTKISDTLTKEQRAAIDDKSISLEVVGGYVIARSHTGSSTASRTPRLAIEALKA
jgi:hypothetical protein